MENYREADHQVIGKSHIIPEKTSSTPNLGEKIQAQISAASTAQILPPSLTELPTMPQIVSLPKAIFRFYSPDGLDRDAAIAAQIMLFEVMETMNVVSFELQSEAVLELYINLVTGIFTSSRKTISKLLSQYHLTPSDITWENAKIEMGITESQYELEERDSLTPPTLFAVVGIYLVLMGKQLTSNNYTKWMESRIKSFTASCGAQSTAEVIEHLVPCADASRDIYQQISSKWEIRREIFLNVRAAANGNVILRSMAQACMTLLSGTELGNFINKYIVIENPILLCWNELAKYSPHLCAAIDKYVSFGKDGPYCKLLYKPSDLPEFNRNSLRTFAAIAREIAVLEGQESYKNYEGTENNAGLKHLIDRAWLLVKSSGGINSITTNAVQASLLADEATNSAMLNDLGQGAHVEGVKVYKNVRGSDCTNPASI